MLHLALCCALFCQLVLQWKGRLGTAANTSCQLTNSSIISNSKPWPSWPLSVVPLFVYAPCTAMTFQFAPCVTSRGLIVITFPLDRVLSVRFRLLDDGFVCPALVSLSYQWHLAYQCINHAICLLLSLIGGTNPLPNQTPSFRILMCQFNRICVSLLPCLLNGNEEFQFVILVWPCISVCLVRLLVVVYAPAL